MLRIGIGNDTHKLVEQRDLIIGGVKIPFEKGLKGHSDADVLIHAIIDSLFGALALNDIGYHFPDTSEEFKDVSSMILLEKTKNIIKENNYDIVNIDSVVSAQKPHLAPYILNMRENIAKCLDMPIENVSIKAKTGENIGFVGREEGMYAQAVCLLSKIEVRG